MSFTPTPQGDSSPWGCHLLVISSTLKRKINPLKLALLHKGHAVFAKPAFLPVLVGIWSVPVIIAIIVSPFPSPLAILLPPVYGAALGLQEARALDLDQHCYSQAASNWRLIERDNHPASWFLAITLEGSTPAARLYGLIGLARVEPRRIPWVLTQLPPRVKSAEVPVWEGEPASRAEGYRWVPFAEAATMAELTRFAAHLSDTTIRGEC